MMLPLIELCEQNSHKGNCLLMEDAWLKTHADFLLSSCLSECQLCQTRFFIFVEGEKITGDSPQELMEKTIQTVKKIEKEFDFL